MEWETVTGSNYERSLQHHPGVSSRTSGGTGGIQAYWVSEE